jgi:hypothetical protein
LTAAIKAAWPRKTDQITDDQNDHGSKEVRQIVEELSDQVSGHHDFKGIDAQENSHDNNHPVEKPGQEMRRSIPHPSLGENPGQPPPFAHSVEMDCL